MVLFFRLSALYYETIVKCYDTSSYDYANRVMQSGNFSMFMGNIMYHVYIANNYTPVLLKLVKLSK